MSNKNILAIDIGSTKICAIVAEIRADNVPFVLGTGTHRAEGIKKGSITNIELASNSIRNAVNDAKRVSGENINKAVISLSGAYTKSVRETTQVNVSKGEIGMKEISRIIQTAVYNASIADDHVLIHALPYEFKLDGQNYAEDPMGMSASSLQASVHIITVKKTALENLKRAVREAGIEIDNVVLSSYASSIAVLSEEEKDLGVACIDMGGQTCELMIYNGYSMRYSDFLSVGSHHITIDLATALNANPLVAEEIKTKYGNLTLSNDDKERSIRVPIMTSETETKTVPMSIVHAVISARVEETLQLLAKSIEQSGLKDKIGAGITLTGGMANLEGMQEFASNLFFRKPVRISKPKSIAGLFDGLEGAHSATAVGLVLHAAGQHTNYEMDYNKLIRNRRSLSATPDAASESDVSNVGNIELPRDYQQIGAANGLDKLGMQGDVQDNVFKKFYKWLTQLF